MKRKCLPENISRVLFVGLWRECIHSIIHGDLMNGSCTSIVNTQRFWTRFASPDLQERRRMKMTDFRERQNDFTYNKMILKCIKTFNFDIGIVRNENTPMRCTGRVHIIVRNLHHFVVDCIFISENKKTRPLMSYSILLSSTDLWEKILWMQNNRTQKQREENNNNNNKKILTSMPWRLGKKSRSCVLLGILVSKNWTSVVIRLSVSTKTYRPSLLLTTDTRKRSSVSSHTHTHTSDERYFCELCYWWRVSLPW